MRYNTKYIFAAGMRRSGSTWQYHLARDLIVHAGGFDAKWVTWQGFDEMHNETNEQVPFVILKTHAYTPEHTALANLVFDEGRALALYIYRDLRDVAASLYGRKMTEDWNTVLANLPVILRMYKMWTDLPVNRCIKKKYETFSPSMFLLQLRGNLGIEVTNPRMRKIIAAHSLSAHKHLLATQDYGATGYNRDTLFWNNHLDNGTIGRYKTELTAPQIADVESIAGAWLKKRGYMNE